MTYFLLRGSKSCFPLTNLFFHVLRRMHYSTKEEKIHVFLFLLGWINARQRCSTYDRVAKWKIWQIVSLLLSKCQHIALPLKPSVSVNLYMASPHSVTDSLLGVECCLASSKVILTIWNICQHAHTHTRGTHTTVLLYQCNPPYMKCLCFVGAKPRWVHNNRTQRNWAAGQRLRTGILLYSGKAVWEYNVFRLNVLDVMIGVYTIFWIMSLRLYLSRKNKKLLSGLWSISDRSSLMEWLQSNFWHHQNTHVRKSGLSALRRTCTQN